MSKVYVGDTGTEIICDAGGDITDQTDMKLLVRRPDGSGGFDEIEWDSCTVYKNRKVRYATVSTDLTTEGRYYAQSWVETPSGTWTGDDDYFDVYGKLVT